MVEATDPDAIRRKRKAICALFPYAVYLARDGQEWMAYSFTRVARASDSEHGRFMWRRVEPYILPLFDDPNAHSLNSVIILVSPYMPWSNALVGRDVYKNAATGWAAAVSAAPYTEEVGQDVVDVLLQIASIDSLRPHIPVDIRARLMKQPSLPPKRFGRSVGTHGDVVYRVRALGDVGILKSYLLLVWSEWNWIWSAGLDEMHSSIREEFSGIGMRCYREDLIKRLDHILGQLDRGLGHLQQHKPRIDEDGIETAKEDYGELKRVLLEVDGEAMNILTRTPPRLILFGLLTNTQDLIRPSCVLCLSYAHSFTLGKHATTYSNQPPRPYCNRPPLITFPLCIAQI